MIKDRPKVLVIDDETFYINVLVDVLKDHYQVSIAKNGKQGLRLASGKNPPDIVLLDILMPDMDGYEVCRQIKNNEKSRDIPVIFLTIKSEVEDEVRGYELGAVDYIIKPISPPVVRSRVKNHLALAKAKQALKEHNGVLELRVKERTEELVCTQDVAILCLASLAETRDSETGNHIRRCQHYVRLLADHLRDHPAYRDYLTETNIDLLFKSAALHDIGKVGVPDGMLLKPGKLDQDEWEEMKRHTVYGYEAIVRAESAHGTTSFLVVAKEIVLTHHEKWDGSGYPGGLAGNEIPISGRLVALADVYDALISKRVYKEAFPHREAVRLITEQKGKHFDPEIVDAFEVLQDEFHRVAQRLND